VKKKEYDAEMYQADQPSGCKQGHFIPNNPNVLGNAHSLFSGQEGQKQGLLGHD